MTAHTFASTLGHY